MAQQARSGASAKPAACSSDELASISPVEMAFAFDDATISEVGQKRLAQAAAWLVCNPHVEVVIVPDADNHGATRRISRIWLSGAPRRPPTSCGRWAPRRL